MNILFLSRWFPIPANNGSKLRIYNLMRGLADYHEVTLLSFTEQPTSEPDSPEIRSLCSEVHVIPWREFDPRSWHARIGFLRLVPRFLLDTHSKQMEDLVQETLSSKRYDLVIASQLSMAAYAPYFGNTPALFDEIELGIYHGEAIGAKNFPGQIRYGLTWWKLHLYLSRIFPRFSALTVVSEQERHLLSAHFPKHREDVHVIPNCINFEEYHEIKARPAPGRLIFTGSFRFKANYEAMLWFVREVLPGILEQAPETQLVITGDHADLPFPHAPNIIMTGYVEDIKSLIASSRVSIAPLLTGGGTRLKILEAMAIGTPVVATSKGAEGLDILPGEQLLVADSPDEFSNYVLTLLKDDYLHDKMSVNGKLFVKENYDWRSVLPHFLNLVDRIVSGEDRN